MDSNKMMELIANGDESIDLSNIQNDADMAKRQLRLFLLAQAQRELGRVLKLTKTLDMLQDKYEAKVQEYIETHDDESAVAYLPVMIDTITKCLDRSNNIVSRIVDNKEIMNLMFINAPTTNNTVNMGQDDMRTAVSDPVAREKIREAVNKALSLIQEGKVINENT